MKGTLGWQLVDVVVGQLQSRRVFGRKDNVTTMVGVLQVRTCQKLVHVGYDTMMTVSLVFFRPTPYGFRQVVQHVSKQSQCGYAARSAVLIQPLRK